MKKEDQFLLDVIRNNFNPQFIACKDISGLDFEYVTSLVDLNRIFPQFYNAIIGNLEGEYKQEYIQKWEKHTRNIDTIINEFQRVHQVSMQNKIRFLIVKGIVLAQIIYDDLYTRHMNDIDILVEEEDALRMDHAIRSLGYLQPCRLQDQAYQENDLLPYPIMRLRHTNHYFEYHIFGEQRKKIEIHKYLYFVRPHISEFIWNTSSINIQGTQINTPDIYHTLILLITNAFQNSETLYACQGVTTLREYIDLYCFLKKYSTILNWDHVISLAIKYDVHRYFSVVLKNMHKLYGDTLDMMLVQKFVDSAQHDKKTVSLPWKTSFIDRMLDQISRRSEVKQLLKKLIFSQERREHSIAVTTKKTPGTPGIDSLLRYENKFNIDIRYGLEYDNRGLFIFCYIDEQLYRDFDKFLMQFVIVDSDANNENLYSVVETTYNSNALSTKMIKSPIMRDSNVLRNSYPAIAIDCSMEKHHTTKGQIISIFVPFSNFNIEYYDNPIFGLQVNIFKYVINGIYHNASDIPQGITDAQIFYLA